MGNSWPGSRSRTGRADHGSSSHEFRETMEGDTKDAQFLKKGQDPLEFQCHLQYPCSPANRNHCQSTLRRSPDILTGLAREGEKLV